MPYNVPSFKTLQGIQKQVPNTTNRYANITYSILDWNRYFGSYRSFLWTRRRTSKWCKSGSRSNSFVNEWCPYVCCCCHNMGLHMNDIAQTPNSFTTAKRLAAKCPASWPKAPINQPMIANPKDPHKFALRRLVKHTQKNKQNMRVGKGRYMNKISLISICMKTQEKSGE